MTDDRINQAIDNAKPGIKKYLELMDLLYAVDVSKDEAFQKKYKGFYRVRRNDAWCLVYFRLMEESKSRKPTFPDILDALHARIGNDAYEPSFASKLVATLNPLCPVWDVHVLRNTGHTPPSYTSRTKHADANTAYVSIVDWYGTFMKSSEARQWIRLFSRQVTDHDKISDLKKVDFILWQTRGPKGSDGSPYLRGMRGHRGRA